MSEAHIQYFEVASWPVYFGFTTDKKKFKKEMKRLGVKDEVHHALVRGNAGATTHILEKNGKMTIIVGIKLRKGATKSQVAGLIAHEATHVWHHINKQMDCECPGGEHLAYGVQWLTQCMLSAIPEFNS